MSRCFLSRFLALSDTDNEEIIDDVISENENDDDALRDSRARVLQRDFRLFFYSGRCLIHCLNQKLERKL